MIDNRLRVLVWHIRDVAAEIAEFVAANSQEQVKANLFAARGLVHSLYMVADLATRLQNEHPEFVAAVSDVAWRDIRGLRNRIAHSYFELDHEVVWRAAVVEVPVLAGVLVERLDNHGRA
ncbi:DUF86 domain-containing protein [Devosia sp.]|uniref:HepT-like ribonuclease domain-containing protein n=1 Tax=Devosia sp. TaxID=1871048 RepID=UPI0035B3D553